MFAAGVPEGLSAGDYVLIAVSDTGRGMDPAISRRVFEPFFTTKDVGKGTGLGLSQVYGFVRQSGGHVRIDSAPDVGTSVEIYLPRAAAGAVQLPEPVAGGTVSVSGDEAILVVEDHDDLRDYLVGTLVELGYTVAAAANASEALALVEQREDLDLLLTDVVLPGGMNGRQLSLRAVQLRPGLKVLFMTGYAENAIVHDGRVDPDVALISKPFTGGQLAEKVRARLDGRPLALRP